MIVRVVVHRRHLIGKLEALYRTRYREFLRVATAVAGDESAGHDAVQEGFARALKSARSYRGEGTLEAWVWPIVLNAARAGRTPMTVPIARPDLDVVKQNGNAPDADAEIRAWVAALPERQRLAVFLRYYAGLDYRSIATALGVEVGTVSATLSSAHAALRRSLKEVSR
jgi:RNA polymerase sigma factor (sigma-70 family)